VWFDRFNEEWVVVASLIQIKHGWSHKRPPDVEIRTNPATSSLETWFHMQGSEGVTLCRFIMDDMPMLLEEWINFLKSVDRNKDSMVTKGLFAWLFGDVMARSNLLRDRLGRTMPPLVYFKHAFSERTAIGVGHFNAFSWSLSLPDFIDWCDQVIEVHKPYLPTGNVE
jgi:hypothetical protein